MHCWRRAWFDACGNHNAVHCTVGITYSSYTSYQSIKRVGSGGGWVCKLMSAPPPPTTALYIYNCGNRNDSNHSFPYRPGSGAGICPFLLISSDHLEIFQDWLPFIFSSRWTFASMLQDDVFTFPITLKTNILALIIFRVSLLPPLVSTVAACTWWHLSNKFQRMQVATSSLRDITLNYKF